jgi:hypothetical protein
MHVFLHFILPPVHEHIMKIELIHVVTMQVGVAVHRGGLGSRPSQSSGICGGQSDTGTGFPLSISIHRGLHFSENSKK